MTGAFVCEQCKKACDLCRKEPRRQSRQSALSMPLGSRCSDPGMPKRKHPDKPIYVAADPVDQTCIVVGRPSGGSSCSSNGGGSGGGRGAGGISVRFPGSTSKLMVSMPDLSNTNGGQTSGAKYSNCIQINGTFLFDKSISLAELHN